VSPIAPVKNLIFFVSKFVKNLSSANWAAFSQIDRKFIDNSRFNEYHRRNGA